jgi:sterol desaturase/sphingolipid hydroxylase (fatty acid hydroxylase superfamily)
MDAVILYALPVFGLLMALEFAWGLARDRNTYGLADTLASLSQGLLSQVVAACTQLIQIGLYTLAFPFLTLTPHAAFWQHAGGLALAVLLYDFCDYWLHRVSHESALFWAAHVVHHQSRHFNLSTALRQESAYALSGWPFFLPMAVVGVPPAQFALAGIAVLFYQFWIHTEHVGSLGAFDRWLSTPSNHRVHHATNARYLDRNYGAILMVWDRLFGSFEPESPDEPCVYGTTLPLAGWDPLAAVGTGYVDLWRKFGRARGWRDRLGVLFRAPSWRPASALASVPDPVAVPAPAAAPATRAQAGTATALFVLSAACTGGLLWRVDELSRPALAGVAACLVTGLWAIGAVLDRRLAPAAAAVLGAAVAAGAAGLLAMA